MNRTTTAAPTSKTSAWEKNLLGVPLSETPRLLPGLLTVGSLAWLSLWLSELIGVTKLLLLFVVGFLALAALRSLGDATLHAGGAALGLWNSATWQGICESVKTWAETLLVVALAGVGLSTNLRAFKGLGLKPFLVGLGAALAVGVVSYLAISLLGKFVTL